MAKSITIPGPREIKQETLAKEVIDLFSMQFEYARDFLDEANKCHQVYDQVIDLDTWDTSSEITLGGAFALVQNILPAIMYYTLWAPEVPFELIPRDPSIPYEVARRIRDNLVYTQRERMNLEVEGYYAILDALKFGVGYSLVEPKRVQLPDYGIEYAVAGVVKEQRSSLEVGKTIDVTSSRHLTVGQVYPSPDGEDPNEVSAITVLDYINEFDLRQLYQLEDNPYKGEPEEIIEYAKKQKLSGYTASPREMADFLCGHKQSIVNRMNTTRGKNFPVLVPVLKQYRRNHHIWLACDKFVMYEIKDQFQTLQHPIAKATFTPEGNQWFTKGLVARAHDGIIAVETWVNYMMDLFSRSLHPHKIVNTLSLAEEDIQEDVVPYGVTYVRGDPKTAINFLEFPQLPPQAFTIPNQIEEFVNKMTGAGPSPQTQSTPGLVRGGSGALESLLQVSTGREKATAKHIENGWYKQICLLTLIFNQLLINEKDEFTYLATASEKETGSQKKGEKYFKLASITVNEIRQGWRFEFNFREKLRNILAESAQRIQVYMALKDNPIVSEDGLVSYLIGDEYLANRLMQGVDVEKRRAEIAQMATLGAGKMPAQSPITAGRGVGMPV